MNVGAFRKATHHQGRRDNGEGQLKHHEDGFWDVSPEALGANTQQKALAKPPHQGLKRPTIGKRQ